MLLEKRVFPAGDVASNVCDVVINVCDVAGNMYDVASNECDVASNMCDVASKVCDVASNVRQALNKGPVEQQAKGGVGVGRACRILPATS